MEVINHQNRPQAPERSRIHHVYLGAALIAVGAVWMLHNFDVIGERFFDLFFSWEMLLIVIGGYLLAMRKWAAGGIVAAVGAFFMATDVLGVCIPFDKVVLPLICIAAGAAVLLTRRSR